jgi:hypothetical protein
MLIYPLLRESGLSLGHSVVDVYKGGPGDSMIVTFLTLGTIITLVGHRSLHCSICYCIARNANMAREPVVFN